METATYSNWLPIETAPKGYPALEEPSEWFLAYGDKYAGPMGEKFAVVRRCFGHGFGPWECTGNAYYREDFFSHWMPLPEAPSNQQEGNVPDLWAWTRDIGQDSCQDRTPDE